MVAVTGGFAGGRHGAAKNAEAPEPVELVPEERFELSRSFHPAGF